MPDPSAFLAGPTGLGTSAVRLFAELADGAVPVHCAPGPRVTRQPPLTYAMRPWADGSMPPLYCPLTVRVDDKLATLVNERLVEWAEEIGLHEGRIEQFRQTGFGRLITLAHPDVDDPDRLLLAAQMNAAWWASDDYYADETELGADPELLAGRLALAMSSMDAPPPADEFTEQLDEHLSADPVLVSLTSARQHVARHATPSQIARVNLTSCQMWVSWNAYGAWRQSGEQVEAWRYLAARQHDSFYTSMTLIDIAGGYEVPANLFYKPRVHRAAMRAGTAAVIVNDLHSALKEAADERPDCNLVLLVAEERGCSLREAAERAVALHNDMVAAFEADCRELAALPSPELRQFLWALGAWLGGSFEWHSTTNRYSTTET
ncbi:family 2 encapsulin nanocompartment cargo protein terpene cyclase [Nonomuraea typhae]|uniref:Terpene synthase n=1 Tax=Nonomuraea typhae TaxID=2603600 RepID=A0ABW7YZX3_9ACTN